MLKATTNKIAARAGWFKDNAIGSIEHIMRPEITQAEFLAALEAHGVPLSKDTSVDRPRQHNSRTGTRP
ncbi:MAG: hypothetical protein V4532_15725, partial [Pseudomonadota bacterium]